MKKKKKKRKTNKDGGGRKIKLWYLLTNFTEKKNSVITDRYLLTNVHLYIFYVGNYQYKTSDAFLVINNY